MHRLFMIVAALAVAASPIDRALAQATGAAETGDPVVAIVNGDEIQRSDVLASAADLPAEYRQVPVSMIFDQLLDRLIDGRLLAEEAERRGLASEPDAQKALEHARMQVLRSYLLRSAIAEGTTDEALEARYETAKESEDFAREQIKARHILLATEEEAKAAIEELQAGADFAELAKERSTGPSGPNGGELQPFQKGQMVPEFEAAAFAMEPGTYSEEPVQTQFGWHVILVEEKQTSEPTFEESEAALRQELARELASALIDELRAGAEIERFNPDGSPVEAE